MGITAAAPEILSSGWAVAAVLQQERRRAYVIGESGLLAELEHAGVPATTATDALDPAVSAVVVRRALLFNDEERMLLFTRYIAGRLGSTASLRTASWRRRRRICGTAPQVT